MNTKAGDPLIVDSLGMAPKPVAMEGARGAVIRELITDRDGAPTFAMRLFELAPEGHTPKHSHPHEHEIYILAGAGQLGGAAGGRPLRQGDAVFVPGGVEHQFANTGSGPLRFLCLIPIEKKSAA